MSWEYRRHKITCKKCGNSGIEIRGSDDWGQTSVEWEGFESTPSPAYEVARMREGSYRPLCKCGGTSFHVGDIVAD